MIITETVSFESKFIGQPLISRALPLVLAVTAAAPRDSLKSSSRQKAKGRQAIFAQQERSRGPTAQALETVAAV